ncbi:MAG: DUF4350 domain-containing protein [Mucilaginibacter sp.]
MKSLKLYLIAGAVLLIIYIVALLNRPKTIDWTETFGNKDKIPFGTYLLSSQLGDIFPGERITPVRRPVYNVIAEDSIKQACYIIICQGAEFSKPDYTELIKYIKQGNDVFIAAEYFGKLFDKNLKLETNRNFDVTDHNSSVRFLSPYLHPEKTIRMDKNVGSFYFTKFDTTHAVVLSEDSSHKANFVKYTFGKGDLYLCANPGYFSNYSLLKPDGAAYAATALSFLKTGEQIVLDEYYTQGDEGNASPMRLFLKNPLLQWAYYIALFSLVLFVLYEIKRRQRIIPVIEPLSNSTLDFVNVVGRVYYEERNNANIAQKNILYFLTWLRDEYQIKTNKLDEEFTAKLTGKLAVEHAIANDLVGYIKYISVQENVNDRELIELNKLIEKFYNRVR